MANQVAGLERLLVEELQDLFDAEKQLVRALPRMAKSAADEELEHALRAHLEVTRKQVQRIEQIFASMDMRARSRACKGMKAIVEEGQDVMADERQEATLDSAITGAARKVEHYEIAGYEAAQLLARQLGLREAARLLEQTLREEIAADRRLAQISRRLYKETGVERIAAITRPARTARRTTRRAAAVARHAHPAAARRRTTARAAARRRTAARHVRTAFARGTARRTAVARRPRRAVARTTSKRFVAAKRPRTVATRTTAKRIVVAKRARPVATRTTAKRIVVAKRARPVATRTTAKRIVAARPAVKQVAAAKRARPVSVETKARPIPAPAPKATVAPPPFVPKPVPAALAPRPAVAATSHPLLDHGEIRRWAEERGASPACVRGTGFRGDVGMIRLDFPGYTGEESLEHISWDDWFRKFDERNLALLVQDTLASGGKSNFNKLVSRESVEGRPKVRTAR